MKTVHVIVTGRVQGVGYRWHTRNAATAHGVTGWVRNLRDGSVEAALYGTDDAVSAVLTAMREGPVCGRVETFTTADAPLDAAPSGRFEIRHTD